MKERSFFKTGKLEYTVRLVVEEGYSTIFVGLTHKDCPTSRFVYHEREDVGFNRVMLSTILENLNERKNLSINDFRGVLSDAWEEQSC